jgi:hypothetical protein
MLLFMKIDKRGLQELFSETLMAVCSCSWLLYTACFHTYDGRSDSDEGRAGVGD